MALTATRQFLPDYHLDYIHVKLREAGGVRAKAMYLAIDVHMNGHRDVMGLWIAQTEGA